MALTNTYTTGGTFPAADANAIATAVNAKNQVGTFSGRPAAANLDAIYYCTDNNVDYHDTGSAWEKIRIAGSSCGAMGDVPTSGWTASNMQSGSSWAADKDAMLLTAATAQTSFGYQYRTYPGSPFTLTTYLDACYLSGLGIPLVGGSFFGSGIVISDGTKYELFGPVASDSVSTPFNAQTWGIWAAYFSSSSAYGATYNSQPSNSTYLGGMPKWHQYHDDGTNKSYSVSFDGQDWIPILSGTSRTNNLTPTRIGVGAIQGGGQSGLLRVRSWNGVS